MPPPVYRKLYSLEAEGESSETQQKVCAANAHPAAVMAVLLTAVHCACGGHCSRSVSIVVTAWTLPQPSEDYGSSIQFHCSLVMSRLVGHILFFRKLIVAGHVT